MEHKPEYLEVKAKHEALAMDFLHAVEQFDPRVRNLSVKDITYRIYRDIRFSPDKRPYKDWHGIYVCPGGKKSGMAGYYIHFEPANNCYFLCGGLYNPTKEVLQSVREQIMLNPEDFHRKLMKCKGFSPSWQSALKRLPLGFNENDPHSEYYRLKDYAILMPITEQDVLREDFLPWAMEHLKKCYEFNELLNQCVEYAYDPDRDRNA